MLMSVRPAQSALEQSIFIFLGQRALRKQSKSSQCITIRVIQSEPKILRLVRLELSISIIQAQVSLRLLSSLRSLSGLSRVREMSAKISLKDCRSIQLMALLP